MNEEKPSDLSMAKFVTGICSLIPLLGTGPGIACFYMLQYRSWHNKI